MTEHILIEQSDGVLSLTLNRPEKKNALTADMTGGSAAPSTTPRMTPASDAS